MEHQSWRQYGKCAELPAADIDRLFYLGRGQSPKPAKAFCSGCMVRKQCLFFAVYYNEEGIWAGTTDEERKNLRAFIIEEVTTAMSFTFIESRNQSDFLPPQESSSFQSTESSGWDDEWLVG